MSATVEREELGGQRPGTGAAERVGRSGLARYALWQLKDFMRERGFWIAVLGLIGIWIFEANYSYDSILEAAAYTRRTGGDWTPPTEAEHFRDGFTTLVALGSFIATLIATHGIVGRDRERGYQRFLFAKPVSVTRYYLQAFAVNGAGLLLVMAALLGVASLTFMRAVPAIPVLAYVTTHYVMLGGLVMLLSTLVRYDFAVAAIATLASFPLADLARRSRYETWALPLSTLLPPAAALGEMLEALKKGVLSGDALVGAAWMLAYGAACVGASLFVLRRRSISA